MDCSEIEQAAGAARALIVCVAPATVDWTLFITPAIILLSVGVATVGVIFARKTARERATVDLIEKVESTPHYRELHSAFSYHRRMNTFDRLHDPQEEKDKKERQSVLDYLNHYELVSIGIRCKIFDAEIYRSWMLGPFVRDWNAAADFIQRERWKRNPRTNSWEYRTQLFKNYQ